jgi:hypothetical protein
MPNGMLMVRPLASMLMLLISPRITSSGRTIRHLDTDLGQRTSLGVVIGVTSLAHGAS